MLIPVSPSIGLPALFALVLGESAGLPLPGETALIVSGGLAADGQVSLWAVIAVAATAAIIGDMVGYWIGRRGGRKLLLRDGRFAGHRRSAVAKAERYFDRYGVVTVFFARFIPGVRVVGALCAGATEMRWRNFAIANALGCITWATTVSSIAYLAGPTGAVVMVVVGFSIAGVGLAAGWINVRRGRIAEADVDPLAVLEDEVVGTVEPSPPAATAEPVAVATLPAPVRSAAVPRKSGAALAACADRLP